METILLSIHSDSASGLSKRLLIAFLLKQIGDVVEQSAFDKGLHAVAGKPEADIRRADDEIAADRCLVGLVVHVVDRHLGAALLGKSVRDLLQHPTLTGIANVGDDRYLVRLCNRGRAQSRSSKHCARADDELAA